MITKSHIKWSRWSGSNTWFETFSDSKCSSILSEVVIWEIFTFKIVGHDCFLVIEAPAPDQIPNLAEYPDFHPLLLFEFSDHSVPLGPLSDLIFFEMCHNRWLVRGRVLELIKITLLEPPVVLLVHIFLNIEKSQID